MAIVRYKCHTTHKVKVTDHDALMRPNTLTTHFYKELTQTVGKIITSSNTQYKCITAHKYWQNEDPYTVSPQSYRAGTLYNVGQTFNSGGVKYKVNTAYWWWDNAVTEGAGKIKAGTKVTANQIITSGGIQYKALKEFWYFDNAVTEGGANLKKGTKVNVGQTFQADNGTYTCIKAFWHWSAWTDFRTQKGNNQYFTYKVNKPTGSLVLEIAYYGISIDGSKYIFNLLSTVGGLYSKNNLTCRIYDSQSILLKTHVFETGGGTLANGFTFYNGLSLESFMKYQCYSVPSESRMYNTNRGEGWLIPTNARYFVIV